MTGASRPRLAAVLPVWPALARAGRLFTGRLAAQVSFRLFCRGPRGLRRARPALPLRRQHTSSQERPLPVTYVIDPNRALVHTTCSGIVTLQEVLAHFDVLERDPARPVPCDVLLQLVQLEGGPKLLDVSTVADRVGWRPGFHIRRCAIVTDSDLAFGVGRMFATVAGRHFEAASVFRDAGEADRWLASGAPPEG